jgi:hypothetical protein
LELWAPCADASDAHEPVKTSADARIAAALTNGGCDPRNAAVTMRIGDLLQVAIFLLNSF